MNETLLQKYRILSPLAANGPGKLYHGEDLGGKATCILRCFTPEPAQQEAFRDRFYREARSLAQLTHANIVQATDFFDEEGNFYLVTEQAEGYRLDTILQKGRLTEKVALHIIKQVLGGLEHAHQLGIIHRSLKPSAVTVGKNGHVKIADFGAAAMAGQQSAVEAGSEGDDACYLSPEQIVTPSGIDRRCDVYAAGVLLFAMLAGQKPFAGTTRIGALLQQLENPVPAIRSFNPDVSPELAELVHRAMEKAPDARFASCGALLHALELYQQRGKKATAQTAPAPPPLPPSRGRKNLWLKLTALGLLLSTAVVAGLLYAWTPKTILRLHGSNTIGSKLAPALAEEFLRRRGAVRVVRETGNSGEELLVKGIMERGAPLAIEIKSHGSATAFAGLAAARCDIGMSSRPIKKEEAAQLAGMGEMTSAACEHVLGLDGVAVIVNRANSVVTTLGKDDLRKIFTGAIADWAQVGGSRGPIRVFSRDEKSGTFDTFKSLVLDKEHLAANAIRLEDSARLSAEVAANPGAIGFIGLPFVKDARAVAIAGGAAMAVLPTAFTVATEEYPLYRRLYLYSAAQPANGMAREFLEFALSADGQEIVEKTGFVSLTVKQVKAPPPPDAPAAYADYGRNASRLSLSFRFRPDSTGLDNRGIDDLERLVAALGEKEFQGRPVMLFGFSEDLGDEKENQRLSLERARLVAAQLKVRGIPASVVAGFGAKIPLADSGSKESSQRNNRVEVWLGQK